MFYSCIVLVAATTRWFLNQLQNTQKCACSSCQQPSAGGYSTCNQTGYLHRKIQTCHQLSRDWLLISYTTWQIMLSADGCQHLSEDWLLIKTPADLRCFWHSTGFARWECKVSKPSWWMKPTCLNPLLMVLNQGSGCPLLYSRQNYFNRSCECRLFLLVETWVSFKDSFLHCNALW